MATKAEKLKSGNYRVRASYVDETGTQKFKSFTAPTAKEARNKALLFSIEHKHQHKPENISLREAIERYISNRENILSPSTIVGYQQLKRNAYNAIIDMRLGYLKKEDVQKAINDYAKEHSAKSARNALGLLSVVLKELYPSLDVNGVKLPQARKHEIIIPSVDEVNRIIEAVKDTELYLPVLLGAFLGLRRSEIFALTWDDIDLQNGIITIDKAIVRDKDGAYVLKQTKTISSERELPITSQVKEVLITMDNDKPLLTNDYRNFSQRYSKLCKSIGVPSSFHALRHFNASIMLQLNIPNKYAMERMGHATDNMLKKVYQHTFKPEQEAIAGKLDDFFNGNIKKEG